MVKKKVKKAEKSKVKLKTKLNKTKFLPKGLNVTNVNFKVKQIVIPEQLKSKNDDEPLTKRQLSIKDVLQRLQHHNVKVRLDACDGLSELISISLKEVLEMNLKSLLLGIAELFSDHQGKVRRHVIKCLTELFAKVSNVKISPFFELLLSHTTCAMMHIDTGIQEDSLLIIDAFLTYIPDLITKYYAQILPNFLTLISKLRNESTSRTLIVNLNSSITTVKWRVQVLYRLQAILRTIVECKEEKKSFIDPVYYDGHSTYIPLFKGLHEITYDYADVPQGVVNFSNISDQIDVLLPLLYEICIEVVHLRGNCSDENTMIDYNVGAILSCSLSTFHLLWDYVQKTDKNQSQKFLSKNNQKFFIHILKIFPYHLKDGTTSAKHLDVVLEPKMVKENLTVCYIFCLLVKDFKRNVVFRNKINAIFEYVQVCLVNRNFVKNESGPILLSTITIILDCYATLNHFKVDLETFLCNVIHFFQNNQLENNLKTNLFKLLTKVTHIPNLNSANCYKNWLQFVPKLLCNPKIPLDTVNCIVLLSQQCHESFSEAICNDLESIMDNILEIKIEGHENYPSILKIIHLIFNANLKQEQLDYLKGFAANCNNSQIQSCLNTLIRYYSGTY